MKTSSRARPKRLPQKLFLEAFKYTPRLAVCLLVKNEKGEILLTRRAIPPQKGAWHYPGTFLWKHEKISECFKRLFKDEFGMHLNGKARLKFLGLFENIHKDPRGHVIDAMWKYKISSAEKIIPTAETREARFFKKLPQRIGFNHRDTLKKLGLQ